MSKRPAELAQYNGPEEERRVSQAPAGAVEDVQDAQQGRAHLGGVQLRAQLGRAQLGRAGCPRS